MKDLIELKSRGEEHNYLRRLVKEEQELIDAIVNI